MPPESSFQPKQNGSKQMILLQDAQTPQEAKDNLSSILEGDYNSTVSKSPLDVGRTNHFQMDIPTTGSPIACKPYPIPFKYQKFMGREIRLLENEGCISKSVSPWVAQVIIVPKKQDPLNPQKQQLHLVLDYQ